MNVCMYIVCVYVYMYVCMCLCRVVGASVYMRLAPYRSAQVMQCFELLRTRRLTLPTRLLIRAKTASRYLTSLD